MATWIYLIDCADALLLGIMLGPFFGIGLWVAHQLDKRKKIRSGSARRATPTPSASYEPCTDPKCPACYLRSGGWPKYQRPYSEREAMRVRKAVSNGRLY